MKQDPENWMDAQGETDFAADCKLLIERLYTETEPDNWGVSRERFAAAVTESAERHFAGKPVSQEKLADYVGTLHLQDLALACGCRGGNERAWEYFVATYRNYLRRAAAAILRSSETSPAAQELADSLFAELYGLRDGQRAERSLFRYFHGRSSLKTWLRAVLAQRHVDSVRAGRRFRQLEDDEHEPEQALRRAADERRKAVRDDPHRERYVGLFTRTLEVALGLLETRDKERLRLYYAEELTLAEIGRRLGEHESSVSRNLERTRRELRAAVEQALRKGHGAGNGLAAEPGLSEEEILLCFEYGAQDAPIDFGKLFRQPTKRTADIERKRP
jgi:RNA polymerase sigma-70 factor